MDTDPSIYIVVSVGDGASIERLTRAQLMDRLNEKWWGAKRILDVDAFERLLGRTGSGAIDLMATAGLFIIKGDLVVPKPAKVVETWSLP